MKDEICLLTVRSSINQDIDRINREYFNLLSESTGKKIRVIEPDELSEGEYYFVYIASGGSEQQFRELMKYIGGRRIYLLTSGKSNSLAASMEILAYIRSMGGKGEIIHGDADELSRELGNVLKAESALAAFRKMKLGQVGPSSDWLIASDMDRTALKDKLGISICDVPMDELLAEYEKHSYKEDQWTELLKNQDFDKEEVERALWVYGALDRISETYGLSGLSVRCFDLLTSIKTTGCLGLAVLNARGIFGGCEGDMPALVSMAILGEISGKPVFMCNPSQINTKSSEMVFAHCTLPLNMPYKFRLDTHFESDIGVAIAGAISEGDATIFKVSNDLGRYYASKITIEENLNDPDLCRSQIRIKLPDCRYFLEEPIQNHHLICSGDETKSLEKFFKLI